jgi:membrane-associated phospholipid phosphatase
VHGVGRGSPARSRAGSDTPPIASAYPAVVLPWIIVAVGGTTLLVGSTAAARHPRIHPAEQRVFHAVNGLPGWLYVPLWLPMQLGNLVVGMLAGLAVAWWARSIGLAVAVVVATGMKLVTERLIRKEMAGWLQVRQRPGTSETGAVLRGGDVPVSGPSFPSGHVILATAVACVVATAFGPRWEVIPFVLAFLVAFGRVFVGAHNPLDVAAGAGAGLLVGGALAAILVAT